MLGVYLSIKTNSLTGRNMSHFTIFDLSTPLNNLKSARQAKGTASEEVLLLWENCAGAFVTKGL